MQRRIYRWHYCQLHFSLCRPDLDNKAKFRPRPRPHFCVDFDEINCVVLAESRSFHSCYSLCDILSSCKWPWWACWPCVGCRWPWNCKKTTYSESTHRCDSNGGVHKTPIKDPDKKSSNCGFYSGMSRPSNRVLKVDSDSLGDTKSITTISFGESFSPDNTFFGVNLAGLRA